jgi:hypothetical protein
MIQANLSLQRANACRLPFVAQAPTTEARQFRQLCTRCVIPTLSASISVTFQTDVITRTAALMSRASDIGVCSFRGINLWF